MRGGPSCGPAGSGIVPVCPHQSHGGYPQGIHGEMEADRGPVGPGWG